MKDYGTLHCGRLRAADAERLRERDEKEEEDEGAHLEELEISNIVK